MPKKIIKNNQELSEILKAFQKKSDTSMMWDKDYDIITNNQESQKILKILTSFQCNCFYRDKFNIKFILPLKEWPYFKIVHISILGEKKRKNIFHKILNILTYWKASSIIVFLGVDGSGKSTITRKLDDLLSPFFSTYLDYFGWDKFVIPLFIATKRRSEKHISKSKNHYGKTVYKEKLGWFHLTIYYIELLLRYFTRIFPKKIIGRTIIIDRYFYDKLVFLDTTSFKFRFFKSITPTPSFTFLLTANPKIIYKRKDEKDTTMLKHSQESFKAKKNLLDFHVINNQQDIDKTIKKIIIALQEDLIKNKRVIE